MMLKTSSNKLNPAFRLFAFTLRKNVGLLILICIVSLLFCPGYVLKFVLEDIKYSSMTDPDYVYGLNDILIGTVGFSTIITSLIAVLMNIINFSYLYSKKSSDVFHAVPLTRCELLFSRFLSGLAFSFIPMAVIYLSAGMILLVPQVEGNVSILLIGLAYNITIMLICSALSMLFIICAGTAFDMLMSFGVFSGGCLLVAVIVLTFCDTFLWGFDSNSIREILEISSPFAFCSFSLVDYLKNVPVFKPYYIWFFVKAAVFIAVVLTATVLLYRKRKAEKAGDSYAYKFVYVFCAAVVAYIGAFGLGMIFSEGEPDTFVFYLFAAAGAAIAAVTFGAISFRGFKTVKKSLIIGAVAFVCLGITYLIVNFGGLGYSKRVPAVSRVDSVTVSLDGSDYKGVSPEDVIKLHEKIVANKDEIIELREENYGVVIEDGEVNETVRFINVNINYKLKNGRTMSRYFHVPIKMFEKELLEIYTSEERISDIKETLPAKLMNLRICYTFTNDKNNDNTYYSVDLSRAEAERLLRAYAEDVKTATINSFITDGCDGYEISWTNGDEESDYYHMYNSIELTVEPHFTKTQEVLDEIDILSRIETEQLEMAETEKMQ